MLNEGKIKVMTHLARCEKKDNGEIFNIMNFYKYDYIRYNLLKTFISVTIGYVMILGLAVLYHMEYLILNFVTLDYKMLGAVVLGCYFLMLLCYSVVTVAGCSAKYDSSRKEIGQYYRVLEGLRKFYGKEKEQK